MCSLAKTKPSFHFRPKKGTFVAIQSRTNVQVIMIFIIITILFSYRDKQWLTPINQLLNIPH